MRKHFGLSRWSVRLLLLTTAVAALALGLGAGGAGLDRGDRGAQAAGQSERKVILIQGLTSEGYRIDASTGDCEERGGIEGWIDEIRSLLTDRTKSTVPEYILFEEDDFLAVSYKADSYCPGQQYRIPVYDALDTCDGIDTVVSELGKIVAAYPEAHFDIVGHSLGGFVAAYWVSQQSSETLSRIHSVVTLDSPLGDVPNLSGIADPLLELFFPGCLDSSGSWHRTTFEIIKGNPIHYSDAIEDVSKTTHRANFVTMQCNSPACVGGIVDLVVPVTLDGAWRDISIGALTHGAILLHPDTLENLADAVLTQLTDNRDTGCRDAWDVEADPYWIRGTACETDRAEPVTFTHEVEDASKISVVYSFESGATAKIQVDDGPELKLPGDQQCQGRYRYPYNAKLCIYTYPRNFGPGKHQVKLTTVPSCHLIWPFRYCDSFYFDAIEARPSKIAGDGGQPPTANVDVALIIDSSGSMSSNDPHNDRKGAARVYVTGASADGDQVAVVDFDSNVTLASPLRMLPDERTQILDAIDTIDSSGNTDIAGGIEMACNELKQNGRPSYAKGAILLTDGHHNVGPYNDPQECFAQEGWPIYTFALGSADDDLLQRIADETGGQFKRLPTTDLICEFQRVRSLVAGETPQPCHSQHVNPGETTQYLATIPAGQAQATFSANWPGSSIRVSLIPPSGPPLIECDAPPPGVSCDAGDTFVVYRVQNPEPGDWTIELFGQDLPPAGEDAVIAVTSIPKVDSEAPTTTISATGSLGANGWYVSDPIVTLTAVDNEAGTGVAWSSYSLDEGTSWPGFANEAAQTPFVSSFSILSDFVGEAWARSADWGEPANVEEPPAKLPLKVDVTSPAVTVVEPNSGDEAEDDLELAATASDATSGVDGVYFCVRGDDGGDGTSIGHEEMAATFNSAAGQWEYTFDASDLAPGDYIVLASATDEAGNEGWATAVPFSVSPAPTPTPTPTPKPSPTALPSFSMPMVAGWNDKCYVGEQKGIDEALAGIADKVLAVYILNSAQEWERWFPARTDISTITSLKPYDQLFVLMSAAADWVQEESTAQQPSVSLSEGWNSVCYAGQSKAVQEATAGIAGKFSVLYRLLDTQAWARYVPGRPELSDISQVQKYDSVLVLVTQAGGAQWVFDP